MRSPCALSEHEWGQSLPFLIRVACCPMKLAADGIDLYRSGPSKIQPSFATHMGHVAPIFEPL